MKDEKQMCRCGCKKAAEWLCTGHDYDPRKPDGRGQKFTNEPCCHNAKLYLEESAGALDLPFKVVAAHDPVTGDWRWLEDSEVAR